MREVTLPDIFLLISDALCFRAVVLIKSQCLNGKTTLHGRIYASIYIRSGELYSFFSMAQLSSGTCPLMYKKGELPGCCGSVGISNVKSCNTECIRG